MTRRTVVTLVILALLFIGILLFGYERMLLSETRTREAALTALAQDTSRDVAQILGDPTVHDEATREARILATLEKSSRAVHPTPHISIHSNGAERQCALLLTQGRSVLIRQDGSVAKSW
jgi:hypothetical protein